MFLIGDKVVHPMHGAGIIERITHERLGSRVSSYYVFRMPAGGLVLKIPIDACCQIGLRCLSTAEHICQVLSAIPTLEVQMSSNWNQRYRDNLARLKSGDLLEVAWVIKGLMWRDHRRGLSNGEPKCSTAPSRSSSPRWCWWRERTITPLWSSGSTKP